jgi:hypothetical protein
VAVEIVGTETWVCKKCKKEKPLTAFYRNRKMPSGRQQPCGECVKAVTRSYYAKNKAMCLDKCKAYRLKNIDRIKEQQKQYYHKDRMAYRLRARYMKFGITPEAFLGKLNELNFRCEICGEEEGDKWDGFLLIDGKKPLAVDHDHNTGNYRGLLCRRCNKAIGAFGDSIELLEKAVEYLKQRR